MRILYRRPILLLQVRASRHPQLGRHGQQRLDHDHMYLSISKFYFFGLELQTFALMGKNVERCCMFFYMP